MFNRKPKLAVVDGANCSTAFFVHFLYSCPNISEHRSAKSSFELRAHTFTELDFHKFKKLKTRAQRFCGETNRPAVIASAPLARESLLQYRQGFVRHNEHAAILAPISAMTITHVELALHGRAFNRVRRNWFSVRRSHNNAVAHAHDLTVKHSVMAAELNPRAH
jgi:hypothetical protein